jgi:hypothetical protein
MVSEHSVMLSLETIENLFCLDAEVFKQGLHDPDQAISVHNQLETIRQRREMLKPAELKKIPAIVSMAVEDFKNLSAASADFKGFNLAGARFDGATLPNADFENSDLTGANFAGAKLFGARFRGANLAQADFTGATHYEASGFVGAKNLEQAKGLPSDILAEVKGFEKDWLGIAVPAPQTTGVSPA